MTTGKYAKGEHVKIEIEEKQFGASEWMWMLVESSDDEQRLVFGQLDNEAIANADLKLGQQLAVSYDKIRDHRGRGFPFKSSKAYLSLRNEGDRC